MARDSEREWDALLVQHRAEIDYLRTFQGRLSGNTATDSTNGCTVIAPLVAYRHIKTCQGAGQRLPSKHIEHVIDCDTPPILGAIRRKHSLPAGSFIVPADVHDYLYDQGFMSPDLFGGVCGGSVLEDEHIDSFLQTMEDFPPDSTVGAAFFYHEHVVSMLRLGRAYEFVDSMPYPPAGVGVRIKCNSVNELKVCLRWYTLRKFTPSNMSFIDNNAWNDANAEFDPRIFQGFVWHCQKGS